MADREITKPSQSVIDWLWSWWIPTSPATLREAEKKILSRVPIAYRGFYVDIGQVVGSADKIWTISLNTDAEGIPILLIHGLGSGVALWCLNLGALASHGPVYAIDLLGFGRSSRPKFSTDALEIEKQLAESIEEWRKEVKIDKMIILGHSMGAFIATAYALRHPNQVNHLILADPWGFSEKSCDTINNSSLPFWAQIISYVFSPLNPLFAIRAAGPLGQWLIKKARPDLVKKFQPLLGKDAQIIPQYLYHCNIQSPTGESALHCMMSGAGSAKNPMLNRIKELESNISITLIFGSRTSVDDSAGEEIKKRRGKSNVYVQMISGAGNQVYADKYEIFNKQVLEFIRLS